MPRRELNGRTRDIAGPAVMRFVVGGYGMTLALAAAILSVHRPFAL